MAGSQARSRLGLWLAIGALAMSVPYLCSPGVAEGGVVSREMLPSLIIGPEDLPWDAVLFALARGPRVPPSTLGSFSGQSKLEERWSGPPTGNPGCEKTADFNVEIAFAIAGSPEEAVEVAKREVVNVATIIPEVTGDNSLVPFADRAWYCETRIVFTRANVVGAVHMFRKGGFDAHLLLSLATRLGHKIDTAVAGRPEPAPVLPPSAADMKVDLEGAWKAKALGAQLGRRESTKLALQHRNGLATALPAKQVASREYLVPLVYLGGILGTDTGMKVGTQRATASIAGKAMVLERGKAQVRCGRRTVQLSHAVQFTGDGVLVPLSSFVQQVLGQRIAWKRRGTTLFGRLMPAS